MRLGILQMVATVSAIGLPAWGQPWISGVAKVVPHSQYSLVPGTAFVVSIQPNTAYLITLAHVLSGDPTPNIEFSASPSRSYQASIYKMHGAETRKDMAILAVTNPPKELTVIRPYDSPKPLNGADVKIAGYPTALNGTFTVKAGTATTQGLDLVLSPRTESGYSGGPVLLSETVAGMVYDHITDYGRAVTVETIASYLRNNQISWGITHPRTTPTREPPTPSRAREHTITCYKDVDMGNDLGLQRRQLREVRGDECPFGWSKLPVPAPKLRSENPYRKPNR